MNHEQSVDAVKMKHEIQSRLTPEVAELNAEQRTRRLEHVLSKDEKLARLWKKGQRRLRDAS